MPSATGTRDASRGARRAAQGGTSGEGTHSLRPWYALMAPAQTPDPIIRKLHEGVVRALNLPDVRAALEAQGAKPVGGTPAELAAVITADTARWAKVIKDANIQVQQ